MFACRAGPVAAAMYLLSEIERLYANADDWLARCPGGIGPWSSKNHQNP
jgi:hypothetical protein